MFAADAERARDALDILTRALERIGLGRPRRRRGYSPTPGRWSPPGRRGCPSSARLRRRQRVISASSCGPLHRSSLVRTLSYPTTGEWVLVDGRHVERVGAGSLPAADRVVELPGTTIVPGFVDAHVHLTGTGVHQQAPGLGLARSAAELLDAIRAAVRDRQADARARLRRVDLGAPGAAHRRRSGSRVGPAARGRARGRAPVAREPAGAARVPCRGPPGSGARRGRRAHRAGTDPGERRAPAVVRREPRRIRRRGAQLAAAATAAAKAVTTVHEMSLIHERGMRDLEVLLRHRQRLPVDVVPYVGTDQVSLAIELGLPRIGGDLPVDGSIGARTAWVDEHHTRTVRDPAAPTSERTRSRSTSTTVISRACRSASTRSATRRSSGPSPPGSAVFRSLDSRGRRHFRARRHRIEHAEMVGVDLLERAAMLGLALSVQPSFDAAWGQPGPVRAGARRGAGRG